MSADGGLVRSSPRFVVIPSELVYLKVSYEPEITDGWWDDTEILGIEVHTTRATRHHSSCALLGASSDSPGTAARGCSA